MRAPLLDYFSPGLQKEKIPSSAALFCAQFCTADFASKGSFPLLISAVQIVTTHCGKVFKFDMSHLSQTDGKHCEIVRPLSKVGTKLLETMKNMFSPCIPCRNSCRSKFCQEQRDIFLQTSNIPISKFSFLPFLN